MPETKKTLKRIQIIDGLLRNNEYSMDELNFHCNEMLKEEGDKEVSLRTTQGDILMMQKKYHIKLKEGEGKRIKYYTYEDPSFSIMDQMLPGSHLNETALKKSIKLLGNSGFDPDYGSDPLHQWAIVLMKRIANGETVGGQKFIQFDRSPSSTGNELYYRLFCHIADKQPLLVTYKPFGKEAHQHIVHPYQLRQFNRRWYLVGLREFGPTIQKEPEIYVYPVDRIQEIERSKIIFRESPVDLEEHFNKAYGITIKSDEEVVTVKLKVTPRCYEYIQTKPISDPQKLINEESTDEYKVFTINVQINHELRALILTYGAAMEVLEPQSLRNEIREMVTQMQQKYSAGGSPEKI